MLILAFIFKGSRAHLVLFFVKKVPHAIFRGLQKPKNRYQGDWTHSSSQMCKIRSLCRNDEYRSERSISKIYHYSKRIWSGTNALRNLRKRFWKCPRYMCWLLNAHAWYNNYQGILVFREPSFARMWDERGVSMDTKPLPLLRLWENIIS